MYLFVLIPMLHVIIELYKTKGIWIVMFFIIVFWLLLLLLFHIEYV